MSGDLESDKTRRPHCICGDRGECAFHAGMCDRLMVALAESEEQRKRAETAERSNAALARLASEMTDELTSKWTTVLAGRDERIVTLEGQVTELQAANTREVEARRAANERAATLEGQIANVREVATNFTDWRFDSGYKAVARAVLAALTTPDEQPSTPVICCHCGQEVPHYTSHEIRGQDSVEEWTCKARNHRLGCDEYHLHEPPRCCDIDCWCRTVQLSR